MASDTAPAAVPGPHNPPPSTAPTTPTSGQQQGGIAGLLAPVGPARTATFNLDPATGTDTAGAPEQAATGITSDTYQLEETAPEKNSGTTRNSNGGTPKEGVVKAWLRAGAERWRKGGDARNKRLDIQKAKAQARQVKETVTVNRSEKMVGGSTNSSTGSKNNAAGKSLNSKSNGAGNSGGTGPKNRGSGGTNNSGGSQSGSNGRGGSGGQAGGGSRGSNTAGSKTGGGAGRASTGNGKDSSGGRGAGKDSGSAKPSGGKSGGGSGAGPKSGTKPTGPGPKPGGGAGGGAGKPGSSGTQGPAGKPGKDAPPSGKTTDAKARKVDLAKSKDGPRAGGAGKDNPGRTGASGKDNSTSGTSPTPSKGKGSDAGGTKTGKTGGTSAPQGTPGEPGKDAAAQSGKTSDGKNGKGMPGKVDLTKKPKTPKGSTDRKGGEQPPAKTPAPVPRPRINLQESREAGYRDGTRAAKAVAHTQAWRDGARDGYADTSQAAAREKTRLDKAHADRKNARTQPAKDTPVTAPASSADYQTAPPKPDHAPGPQPVTVTSTDATHIHLGDGAARDRISRGEVRTLRQFQQRLEAKTDTMTRVGDATRVLEQHALEQAKQVTDLLEQARGIEGGDKLVTALTKLADTARVQASKAAEIHQRAVRAGEACKTLTANTETRYGGIYQAVVDSPETSPAEMNYYREMAHA